MNNIEREKRTVARMISLYCRGNGHGKTLCPQCDRLLQYARARLDKCPHGTHKPACSKCRIHCYSPSMASEIKKVMRYSGPRMLFRYPADAIRHMLRIFFFTPPPC